MSQSYPSARTDSILIVQYGGKPIKKSYLCSMKREDEISSLEVEYAALFDSLEYDGESLDYSLVQWYVAPFSSTIPMTGSFVSIFDEFKKEMVYESEGLPEMWIHPDDLPTVFRSGIAATKHVFRNLKTSRQVKLIRQYRAFVYGEYRRVTEQFSVLQSDSKGNPWLVLSVTDIAPDQGEPFVVKALIVDYVEGHVFPLPDTFYGREQILSPREIEVLSLVAKGKLSKEIADVLGISVTTVNTHRQHILEHLGVDNSMEAVRYARLLGLLDS